ncbi:MAG: M1 family aminopeptidase [Candidatus Zixiibacteriota bacterium]
MFNQRLRSLFLLTLIVPLIFNIGNLLSAPYEQYLEENDWYDIKFDTDVPQPSVIEPLTRKDILNYDIYADFTCEIVTDYKCHIRISLRALTDLDSILFDLYENTVDSVFVSAEPASFTSYEEHISINAPSMIALGDSIDVDIFYGGSFPSDAIKHGFDDEGMLVIYSLFWPSLARNFYPCVDHPMDKAKSSVSIRTKSTAKVASNGVYLGPSPASDDTSEVVHIWQNNYPITSYNICFSISDNYVFMYDSAMTSTGSVEIRHLVPSGRTSHADVSFGLVPEMIAFYDSIYGQYPFDYFGMYVTPFSAGAMEHQSMVMVGDFALSGTAYEHLISHELSHQWWGDAVAIADWRDFWLNEGMAEYSEFLHTKHFYGIDSAMTYHKNVHQEPYKAYGPIEGEFSVYDPESYLSYTVYRKGACVFHMLHREIGDSLFLPMMSSYYENYKHRNVTTDSLKAFIQDYTGRNLSWFFSQWVYRDDFYPEFQYWWQIEDDALNLYITQVHDGEIYRVNTDVKIFDGSSSVMESIEIDDENCHFILGDYHYADSIILDPDGHILCEKTIVESIDETDRFLPYELSAKPYPNPFNSSFNLQLDGFSGNISIQLLDVMGNVIDEKMLNAGEIDIEFSSSSSIDARFRARSDMSSGIYFIRAINSDSVSITEKILFIK